MDLTEWHEYFTVGLGSLLAEVQEKGESLIRLDVLTGKHKLTAQAVSHLRHRTRAPSAAQSMAGRRNGDKIVG